YIGFKIAIGCRDLSGRLAAAGIITCFGLQAVMHLFVVTTLMPITGVALPLMSYGGSSLITILAGMGILMSIARYTGHFELEA
ncbi:MAG TPA: FtsW/RodA/SpoVE family cell cycle protein, partial [bacterium]|nr:FtsW/RodA/SpoVE family cell cycle protein [bacterium]